MTTPLEKTIKRALKIKGMDYVIAMSPESIKLTRKGHRNGIELRWVDLVSGDAALATALQASLANIPGKATSAPVAPKLRHRPSRNRFASEHPLHDPVMAKLTNRVASKAAFIESMECLPVNKLH